MLPQALSSCDSTPKKLSPMASVGVSPIHSRQNSDTLGSAKSDSEINHKNVYNILKSCQSDDMDTPVRRTYLETDFGENFSGHDSPDEGLKMSNGLNGTSNGDFMYKTLSGSIIRSVHAPGKGKSINYKVSRSLHLTLLFRC